MNDVAWQQLHSGAGWRRRYGTERPGPDEVLAALTELGEAALTRRVPTRRCPAGFRAHLVLRQAPELIRDVVQYGHTPTEALTRCLAAAAELEHHHSRRGMAAMEAFLAER